MSKTILIAGATGQQGKAVIEALHAVPSIENTFNILALTRNPTLPGSAALKSKFPNITLLRGNLDDPESIFASAGTPIWGVFSVQATLSRESDIEAETRQGTGLVDSAIAHGVKHFVYTSADRHGAASDTNPTGVGHLASKHRIELHLKEKAGPARMTWTILRPTGFMENIQPGFFGRVTISALDRIPPTKPFYWIAVADIGWFGAQAFLKPEEYSGRALSLAGDALTQAELRERFVRITGKPPKGTLDVVVSVLSLLVPNVGRMFKWFGTEGGLADIAALREIHPDLISMETWLKTKYTGPKAAGA
ncbi:MAG: hypothetical protein M1832_002121 [Thelocarpon impressellum]|nr:MAG: hypothetical protein M1832_002121 [Thelocarpon impressellum]